jgi:N-acetylmuramoyl-L-alanine amidase
MPYWKKVLILAAATLLGACAGGPPIDRSYTSIGQDSRVRFLVLHYTFGDFEGSLKTLTEGAVSSHYLVSDAASPKVYGLVDESRRAFHAGASSWQGTTNLNASSIGIEIVNRGFQDSPEGMKWYPFTQAQIDAVLALTKQIVARHGITPDRVVGHSDIAPQRKQDPGPLFPWKQFADAGLILWPDAQRVAAQRPVYDAALPGVEWFQRRLARFGYAVPYSGELDEETRKVIMAFQMRYRPAKFDGEPDAETAAMLDALTTPK